MDQGGDHTQHAAGIVHRDISRLASQGKFLSAQA